MSETPAPAKQIRFLIVDPKETISPGVQRQYLDAKGQIGEQAPTPTYVDTVRAAQGKISDREFEYSGIFINPEIGVPAWFAVVRSCHEYRAGVPIFIVHEKGETPKITPQDAKKLGLTGLVAKPLTYSKMYELSTASASDQATPFQEQAPPAAPPPKDEGYKDSDMVEVDLREMAGRTKSMFDLFMRLSNQKYVKILNMGDMLSADRVESYVAKGVKNLYILKTAQADYLAFYDKMVSEVLKDPNVKLDVKTAQVSAQGQSALIFLQNSGFSEQSITAAKQYVTNTVEIVSAMASKSDQIQNLLKDMASYEHSMAVTTIAGLVIKHIGGQSNIISSIGMACFLHDISLVGQGPEVLSEDESLMTPEQKAVYLAHPDEGAKLVKKMKEVPPIVATAIAQHHMRKGKKGFPADKAVAEVNRIAELIGLAHEFLALVKTHGADAKIDPIKLLEPKVGEFSEALFSAFKTAFAEK